jgi:hypothetical protein
MLALLIPVAVTTDARPAQAANDIVTLQNGKPKQPAPTPVPKPRKPGRAMKAMAIRKIHWNKKKSYPIIG